MESSILDYTRLARNCDQRPNRISFLGASRGENYIRQPHHIEDQLGGGGSGEEAGEEGGEENVADSGLGSNLGHLSPLRQVGVMGPFQDSHLVL